MAYTRLPVTPPELEELLLDELDDELEELEDELEDELDDELEELDDELEELLEEPAGGVFCEPPQATKRVISERGSNCRIFKVKPSKVVSLFNRYCEHGQVLPGTRTSDSDLIKLSYRNTIMIPQLALTV